MSVSIKTTRNVFPMIYAYTTPGIEYHVGWIKIGYTEQKEEDRIKQQTRTPDVKWNLEWSGNAVFEGTYKTFSDDDFHSYLQRKQIKRKKGTEWFQITGENSKKMFYEFRENHGIIDNDVEVIPYKLREEQEQAVKQTVDYRNNHEGGEFLWNAKPRFGKTLSVYDFAKRIGAKTVLIVTNRPAIANSWYDDYKRFLGRESGYWFVSEVLALKDKNVLSRSEFEANKKDKKCIEFVSLQDLKGSIHFGGQYDKLKEVADMEWDLLVVDESHEGVDTYKTDVAFDQIKRKFTLYLSGTPFKALANEKFPEEAIFNWTYADEQKKKQDWDMKKEEENPYDIEENPYAVLPRLNLFTYQMSEIVREQVKQGVAINGEMENYAFDLNEFFKVDTQERFVYDSSVDQFLDALTQQEKFPFSTEDLRNKLKHTFWLLDRVNSAKAMAKKLKDHPVFKDYEIILAVGNGKLDDEEENEKSYDKVVKAIKEYDRTITLSVGQLTTGVTVPEWTAVLMLCNMKSPSLYMQAAFRAQNPCLFQEGRTFMRKENAYVFDFDPARTLTIVEKFANDLSPNRNDGVDARKENIRTLLNFFPVIGEDENGEMIELDAEKVLSIPRKIRSVEVVRRGFMSNFLFQNVHNIFGAPQKVIDIITRFEPQEEPNENLPDEVAQDYCLDEEGNVSIEDEIIIGKERDILGDRIYTVDEQVREAIEKVNAEPDQKKEAVERVIQAIEQSNDGIIAAVEEKYGKEMTRSDKKEIKSKLKDKTERTIKKVVADYNIQKNVIEIEHSKELQSRNETGKTTEEIDKEFNVKKEELAEKFQSELKTAVEELTKTVAPEAIRIVETNKTERKKESVEDHIRDYLRGFSRTIPSFLMAYGEIDNPVTLDRFDEVVPTEVFQEVTGITLDEFKFLRDGGSYTDPETNEEKQFGGKLFDEVVFNDSVKEFLALKEKLADYFDEEHKEDIFDYIPPQKTNQIFTPKAVVKNMVDMLEKESPGCFDDKDKTFIDLYMKSGMYITEIVKRLFKSEKMKEEFPDEKKRLEHIFKKQVYGLAPTEIIYKIATNYILGFDRNIEIGNGEHNFRHVDALPYVKEGKLEEKLKELYP